MSGKLAILGGEKAIHNTYPAWPVHDEREVEAVAEVIRSGNWGGYPFPGPRTRAFLNKFLEFQGGAYAIMAANGTVTMEIALRAAGIGWGDEVIVPAYTFQATAAAPMAAGAIPVIADVDADNYCLDPKAVEAAITPRTRAIIPVHLGSLMADMDAIMEIAERHNLIVVEDCAHAHGAQWRGQGAGTIGHFGSFSLQSSKILTSGEGGVLICKTQELAAAASAVVNCGRPPVENGEVTILGANFRSSELHAALAGVQVERLPEQTREREVMVAYMDEALSEVPGIRLLRPDPRITRRAVYRYIFAIDPAVWGVDHKAACAALDAEGLDSWTGYEAMNHYELFQPRLSRLPVPTAHPERFNFAEMNLPAAERACAHEAVWLDESVFRAGREGVDQAVAAIRKVYENRVELAQAVRLHGVP
ncbi:MAG: DegT/DnrJ/EryC1/StrS family aminotransferase [Caldilinea sp.]|jgi:dTDP-4-amino-4,6-dideoxygalactose transaminase